MNKAILVIDMPRHCSECPVCEAWEAIPSLEEYYCNIEKKEVMDIYRKPDWCPLKAKPRIKFTYVNDDDDATVNYKRGWNDCVKKIMGN